MQNILIFFSKKNVGLVAEVKIEAMCQSFLFSEQVAFEIWNIQYILS